MLNSPCLKTKSVREKNFSESLDDQQYYTLATNIATVLGKLNRGIDGPGTQFEFMYDFSKEGKDKKLSTKFLTYLHIAMRENPRVPTERRFRYDGAYLSDVEKLMDWTYLSIRGRGYLDMIELRPDPDELPRLDPSQLYHTQTMPTAPLEVDLSTHSDQRIPSAPLAVDDLPPPYTVHDVLASSRQGHVVTNREGDLPPPYTEHDELAINRERHLEATAAANRLTPEQIVASSSSERDMNQIANSAYLNMQPDSRSVASTAQVSSSSAAVNTVTSSEASNSTAQVLALRKYNTLNCQP